MNLKHKVVAIVVTTMAFVYTVIPTEAISKSTILNNTEVFIGQEITTDSAIKLNIKYKQPIISEEIFFVNTDGFRLNEEYYTKKTKLPNNVSIKYITSNKIKVVFAPNSSILELDIPLIGEITSGNPEISIKCLDDRMQTSEGNYKFYDLANLLEFNINTYDSLLQEGENVLNRVSICNVIEDIFKDNTHTFKLKLLSDEWEFVDGKVEVLKNNQANKFEGNINNNKLVINKIDEWDISEDLSTIMIDGIKIKSCIEPLSNGILQLNIDSDNMESKILDIGEVVSKHSPISLHGQDNRIFELNGATQSSRIYFKSDRVEYPDELKLNVNGGIIHDYNIGGNYDSIQTSDSEIVLIKDKEALSYGGVSIIMQIQGCKLGELSVTVTSPQINESLKETLGQVVKIPVSNVSSNILLEEKIDEELLEKIVEEKLNKFIELNELHIEHKQPKIKMYSQFKDMKQDDWYYESVKKAYELGLITGYEDNTFRADKPVSRAELITIIVRLLELNNK